jgi:ribosome biogenesis GTPase
MELERLGYTKELEEIRIEQGLEVFNIGRVVSEHKERYIVISSTGEYDSEILGHLRFTAKKRRDFPAVGDWVAFQEYDNNKGIIHSVLPRKSMIERQAVGKHGEKQIIATNIDVALIVQSVDRDFNINRIQRYLTISHSAGIKPIIILNKIDLISEVELNNRVTEIASRVIEVPIIAISNETKKGYEEFHDILHLGKTYCLLGSSGVGKSTLLNNLSGVSLMKTDSISHSTSKGKHVTSHRELVVLDSGAVLIDNPGMREVGIVASEGGIEQTFDSINQFSQECRYSDCTHILESGCAVLIAIENKEISQESYDNYQKLEKEKEHFDSTLFERRKKDKEFGKMIKTTLKNKKKY